MTISSFMDGRIQENYYGVQLKTVLLGNKIKVRQNGFAPLVHLIFIYDPPVKCYYLLSQNSVGFARIQVTSKRLNYFIGQ